MNEYSLTPVQEVDGLHIKRDDLYAPFGPGEVNGGKLRQCVMLVNSVKKDYKSLLTYCSIHSPQAPITAAVARANGMPCRIVYGGTTRESVAALPMPRLAMKCGFIHETLKKYGADREFEYHDLFHSPGFVYEKSAAATWGGIRLHPHYEAKTMQWFRSSGIAPESTLFWITGAEPRSPGQS